MGRRWFWLVAGLAFGALDIFERTTGTTVDIPVGVLYGGLVFSLFMAASLTYHELHIAHDEFEKQATRKRVRKKTAQERIDDQIRKALALQQQVKQSDIPDPELTEMVLAFLRSSWRTVLDVAPAHIPTLENEKPLPEDHAGAANLLAGVNPILRALQQIRKDL